jgi:hypothetical protein
MTEPAKRKRVREWHPADIVALVLAIGLSTTIVLILIISGVQITRGGFPQVQLSENATQVLIAGIGGLIGLLGAYIGVNKKPPPE